MSNRIMNVLFLCTGNSARSIMAEAILNKIGRGAFAAYSAGSHPAGRVNAHAIELLSKNHFSVDTLRSKDWAEFSEPGTPVMDFVLTVCDRAAGEVCPIWPGGPLRAHWGVADPAAATGADAEIAVAFADTYQRLGNRIDALLSLPFETLDRAALKAGLDQIGKIDDGQDQ